MQLSTQSRKSLLYFTANNTNKGLTLPGLLGRIFIYGGVFVPLLLPFFDFDYLYFMGAQIKARSADPRHNIGAMNRSQQAYFLEKTVFTDSLVELGIGIKTDTENYSYRILSPMVPVQAIDKSVKSTPLSQSVMMVAQAKKPEYKSYIGVVHTAKEKIVNTTELITKQEICEIDSWTALPSTMPIVTNGEVQCPSGSKSLYR